MSTATIESKPSSHTSPHHLRSEVVAVGRNWSRAQHRLLHLVAELDLSGEWALDGSRTCAHWIAVALDVEVSTAREWLRIGHALGKLVGIDAALGAGRISYSKARLLSRYADAENESELLEIAVRTPAGRLAIEIARWLARHETPEETEDRQHEARSLTWRTGPDGMIVATLRLPPEVAAMPMAAIDAWIMRRHTDGTAPPRAERGGHASADASTPRSVAKWDSVAQQRADALVALMAGGGALVDTEVVLHVRGDGCTLDDGTPIAASVVERIAPESFLRVLIHDAERRPVDASGRHRHPTTRQKRVVHERDRGCVDCGATTLLEADHDPDFAITGRTLVAELKERCWTCHRARHRGTVPGGDAT